MKRGFTVVEIAVVLLLIGILSVGLFNTIPAFNRQAKISKTGEELRQVTK
ncbi:MAG: type II secretion system GspH family protein, partial [Christensenellaceae bacterium]|nr:type II secretion system GspH family protein [Christensenellaceae bacterium]